MADIAAIADGELNADVRAKLNAAIARTNTGTFAEATIGGATDYVDITTGGTLTLQGAATAWDERSTVSARPRSTSSDGFDRQFWHRFRVCQVVGVSPCYPTL